jgi:hypothetical protein
VLQVSLRQIVCFAWFTFVDMYFSEIAVKGLEKLEKIKDGRLPPQCLRCAFHADKSIFICAVGLSWQ